MKDITTTEELSDFLGEATDSEHGSAFMFIANDNHVAQSFYIPNDKRIHVINYNLQNDSGNKLELEFRQAAHDNLDIVMTAFLTNRRNKGE